MNSEHNKLGHEERSQKHRSELVTSLLNREEVNSAADRARFRKLEDLVAAQNVAQDYDALQAQVAEHGTQRPSGPATVERMMCDDYHRAGHEPGPGFAENGTNDLLVRELECSRKRAEFYEQTRSQYWGYAEAAKAQNDALIANASEMSEE